MLKTLFLNMVSISVVTGLLAVMLAIIKKRARIASKWLCICWAVLALRLLVPFNLPVSLFNVKIPDAQVSQGTVAVYGAIPTEQTSAYTENTAASVRYESVDFLGIAVWIWIAGMVVFVLWQMTLYFTERKRMLRWSRMADYETCAMAEDVAQSIGVKQNFKVLICETETPPMLMGVVRPVLFLPSGLEQHQLEIALRHELTHLKRQDILFKIIVTAANAVHWFNPLVHLMAKEADRDTEAACDEAVLCDADRAHRRNYCDTILDMMRGKRIPFATALTYKKEDIMKRFVNILDTSKRKSGLVLTVMLLCVSIVLCGLVGCTQQKENVQTDTTDPVVSVTDTSSVNDEDVYMNAQLAMKLINEYRVQNGLHELKYNEYAKVVAETRLEEAKEKFSHTRPNGALWATAFSDAGFLYTGACENLARGQENAEQVVKDWISSPEHSDNLLNADVTYMHVACSEGEYEGEPYVYWIYLAYEP